MSPQKYFSTFNHTIKELSLLSALKCRILKLIMEAYLGCLNPDIVSLSYVKVVSSRKILDIMSIFSISRVS